MFLDAARVHETVIAHELGHAWVQYVDECEDMRVFADDVEPERLHQLHFVQSFVLDLKVNDLIRRKGFDMSPIDQDHAMGVAQLGELLATGFEPPNPREEVVMAQMMAAQMLEADRGRDLALAKFDRTVAQLDRRYPEILKLAEGLADSVRRIGYANRTGILRCLDECLILAFHHSGEGIDLDGEMITLDCEEPDFDKHPNWVAGATTQLKCEIGRIMAREDIPDTCSWTIGHEADHDVLWFNLPDGTESGPWPISGRIPIPPRPIDPYLINESNRINRERQTSMLHLGPQNPHQAPTNPMPGPPGMPPRNPSPPSPPLRHGPRFYMAGFGRWLTAARWQEVIGGEPPYGYALGNPVTYVDPDGMAPQQPRPHKSDPSKWSPAWLSPSDPRGPAARKCISDHLKDPSNKYCAGLTPDELGYLYSLMLCIMGCETSGPGPKIPNHPFELDDPKSPASKQGQGPAA